MRNKLADDLGRAMDPVALAALAGLDTLDSWQVNALRSDSRKALWLCARQVGKSTTAGLLALHVAIYKPGSIVLLVSPSERQSLRIFEQAVLPIYRRLDRPVQPDSENMSTLRLSNGSAIYALPGAERTVRGFAAVAAVIVDEAARIDTEMISAVSPMLAVSHGRLLALSSAWSQEGWFWNAWTSEDASFERIEVTADECPRLTPEFLDSERELLGDRRYRREYECEFTGADDAMFSPELVRSMFTPEVEPLELTA
jgi:Terminase large subunit, T4likevirus-type, N-terminal